MAGIDGELPYVSINGHCGPNGSSVQPDDEGGTRQALEYLYNLGHRKIAYADAEASKSFHRSILIRREAFRKSATELGLPVLIQELTTIFDNNDHNDSACLFVRQQVLENGATAVLVYDHKRAVRILQAANSLGVKVPQRLSIVGFNDEYPIAAVTPPLTAVAVPAGEMGAAAASLLLDQINSEPPAEPHRVTLPERLVIRASTSPPGIS